MAHDKGNQPRGDLPLAERGEGGGPAGVERSGGPRARPPRSGVPEGMTPDDLQITPDEKRERDSDDWR
jgi:hypothetical protein